MSDVRTWLAFGLALTAGASIGAAAVGALRGEPSKPQLGPDPPTRLRLPPSKVPVFPLDAKGHFYTFFNIFGAYVDDLFRVRLWTELSEELAPEAGSRWKRNAGDGPAVYQYHLGGDKWVVLREIDSFDAPHQIGRLYFINQEDWSRLEKVVEKLVEREVVVHAVLGAVDT